jgi:hypothetical protein
MKERSNYILNNSIHLKLKTNQNLDDGLDITVMAELMRMRCVVFRRDHGKDFQDVTLIHDC